MRKLIPVVLCMYTATPSDPHNVWPAVGKTKGREFNQEQRNELFGVHYGENRLYQPLLSDLWRKIDHETR